MNNTILQVPIDKNIRNQATSYAEKMGFSSLQEVVRLFLNRVAAGEINVSFEPTVKLSTKNEKRYSKMINDIENNKVKLKSYTSVDEMMSDLRK